MATKHDNLSWVDEDTPGKRRKDTHLDATIKSSNTSIPRTMVDVGDYFQGATPDSESEATSTQLSVSSEFFGENWSFSGLEDGNHLVPSDLGFGMDQSQFLPPRHFHGINLDDGSGTGPAQSSSESQFRGEYEQSFSALEDQNYLVSSGLGFGMDKSQFFPPFYSPGTHNIVDQNHSFMAEDAYVNEDNENTLNFPYSLDPGSDFLVWDGSLGDSQVNAETVPEIDNTFVNHGDSVMSREWSDKLVNNSATLEHGQRHTAGVEVQPLQDTPINEYNDLFPFMATNSDPAFAGFQPSPNAVTDCDDFLMLFPYWIPSDVPTLHQLCYQLGQRVKALAGELEEKTRMAVIGVAI